ncbi:MAG: hypothetical protein ACREFT_01375 [Acetobacteraceae bacterium]
MAAAASRVCRPAGRAARPVSHKDELHFFTALEAQRLNALGDAMVPGASAAGLARFIDRNVSVDPASTLLTLRYLDVKPPLGELYREGLRRLAGYADPRRAVRELAGIDPVLHFALRSDAIDVTYGTMAGFAALDVPYLPHIAPEAPW